MNNTKWKEIFRAFYQLECNQEKELCSVSIPWMTKDRQTGYEHGWDGTWTHFGSEPTQFDKIEWLKIKLTD